MQTKELNLQQSLIICKNEQSDQFSPFLPNKEENEFETKKFSEANFLEFGLGDSFEEIPKPEMKTRSNTKFSGLEAELFNCVESSYGSGDGDAMDEEFDFKLSSKFFDFMD